MISSQGIGLAALIIMVASSVYGIQAFGHGVGGETLPPVSIGNRNATLFLNVMPPTFDPQNAEYYISANFYETNTQAVIEHVTYRIEMSKDGKTVFSETFHDDAGNLNIKVVNKGTQIKIDGDRESKLGGWTRKLFSPLTMEGPILISGGLYKFHIQILSVESDGNILEKPITYNASISLAEKTLHDSTSEDGNKHQIGITTYYDQIKDFGFDAQQRQISFSMPFDWNMGSVRQTSVVHQEIHVPKTFAEMLVTKYDATVNGIPLKEASVTIDDYSEDARIVHLILNQQDLLEIADKMSEPQIRFTVMPSKEVKFPLEAYTGNAQFQVGLSWDPPVIYPGQKVKFYIDFNELFSEKKPEVVAYDFVLKQHGDEIYRKKPIGQTNSPPNTNAEEYVFSDDNLGPVIVSIEKIADSEYATVDFVAVVKPQEKPKQTFPIRLTSVQGEDGKTKEGSYFVDMTWIPSELTPREISEFIITIYDRQTLTPVPQAEYDFVISQNGNEVFRKSDVAQAGGSFVNYQFSESNVGPITLRIENIDQSGEYTEIPISVTPEFPFGSVLTMTALFFLVLLFTKLRKNPLLMTRGMLR